MASINTNYGASIALQNLNKTNSELERTQNRINTGKAINSAKDNGAIWAIAQSQRSESASLNAVNVPSNTSATLYRVTAVGIAGSSRSVVESVYAKY